MTVNEAKERIEKELERAKASFEGIGVTVDTDLQCTENSTENGSEVIFLFGAVAIYTDGMTEDDTLIIPLETELNDLGCVVYESFENNLSEFYHRLEDVKNRLVCCDNLTEEIIKISRSVDEELERRHRERVARLNAATRDNLRFALMTTAGLLLIAAIILLVNIIAKRL